MHAAFLLLACAWAAADDPPVIAMAANHKTGTLIASHYARHMCQGDRCPGSCVMEGGGATCNGHKGNCGPCRQAYMHAKYSSERDGDVWAYSDGKQDKLKSTSCCRVLFFNHYMGSRSLPLDRAHSGFTYAVLHFVRDPFDLIASAYLYVQRGRWGCCCRCCCRCRCRCCPARLTRRPSALPVHRRPRSPRASRPCSAT